MADLLECLIQIKGVADTPRRLGARWSELRTLRGDAASASVGTRVFATMSDAETRFQHCLKLMLANDRPSLPSLGSRPDREPRDPETGCEHANGRAVARVEQRAARFTAARAETVAVLDRCTAEDLNRVGLEPARGPMTVADLVALMLAHDTDQLARLVEAAHS